MCALLQVLVQGLLLQLWAPLQSVGGTYRRLKKALVDLEDYVNLLRMPATPSDGSLPLPSVWQPPHPLLALPPQHDSTATSASAATAPLHNPAATQKVMSESAEPDDHKVSGKPAMAAPMIAAAPSRNLSRSRNLAAISSLPLGATVTQTENSKTEETAAAALPSEPSMPRQPLPREPRDGQSLKSGRTSPAAGKHGGDVTHRKARGKRHTKADGNALSDSPKGRTLSESADGSMLSDTSEGITLSDRPDGCALSDSLGCDSADGSGSISSVGSRHSTAALSRPGATTLPAADTQSAIVHSVSSEADMDTTAGNVTDSSVTAGIKGLHVQFQDVFFGYDSCPTERTQEAAQKLPAPDSPRSESEGQLVRGLSFEVSTGECIGIVGPPGRVQFFSALASHHY